MKIIQWLFWEMILLHHSYKKTHLRMDPVLQVANTFHEYARIKQLQIYIYVYSI